MTCQFVGFSLQKYKKTRENFTNWKNLTIFAAHFARKYQKIDLYD